MERQELIQKMDQGFRPKFLLFWGHRPRPDGSMGAGCLSNWWRSAFVVDGVQYPTAEHYMMAKKARLFGDEAELEAVLKAPHPKQAKAAGRRVRGFDPVVWEQHRLEIVTRACVEKFSQNAPEGRFLVGTGGRILVEASPRDRIWGIGMGARNPHAMNPRQWRGQNLLGVALMRARAHLRHGS